MKPGFPIFNFALAFVGLAATIALAACARGQATPTPPPATVSLIEMGQTVYAANCAACHGQDAQGTAMGPSLPGHSREAIVMQVRKPLGTMPAFPASKLSDEDLDKIVAYIMSLGPAMMEGHEFEVGAPEAIHHFMALQAIKAGDLQDATHHIQHALDFVTEHEHEHQMKEVVELLKAGKGHDAEHELEEMVAAHLEQHGKTLPALHLELAQGYVQDKNMEQTQHHLNHFIELASGTEKLKAQEALNLVAAGDWHEAGHAIEMLMGMTPHGG